METTRRTIAKGAVWAVPTIALGAAAPAIAASTTPLPVGLQGWAYWSRSCPQGYGNPGTLRITKSKSGGTGDVFPNGDYGYYVYNTTSTQISGACMTFSYPSYLGNLTWSATSNNGSWSTPRQVTRIGSGYTTYTTCYSGSWLDVKATRSTPAHTRATSYPDFSATSSHTCDNDQIPIVITRTVSVDGKPISFDRTIAIGPLQ